MADQNIVAAEAPKPSEPGNVNPLDSVFAELQLLGGRFSGIQTEVRNRFDAIFDRLDEIERLVRDGDKERIEVRTAHIDRPLPVPNSETKRPTSGRPEDLPEGVTLWAPERDDPRLAKLHQVAAELIQALTDRSSLPQKLQANLVRASDAWRDYLLQTHSTHKLSSSTYNRIAKYDVRWYRNAKDEFSWNWPLNSEGLALAFVEAIAQVCRSYRIDTSAILKRGKVKLSEPSQR